VDRLRFHVFDGAGQEDFRAGAADLERVRAARPASEPLAALLDRLEALGYQWGVSDGN
jgi:hypothetical protein